MISSRVIHDPEIWEVTNAHKFQMTEAIVQQEFDPRNNFNQVYLLNTNQHIEP